MVALGLVGFKSRDQVSQALTVTELSEHQSKELIPAGEMLDITVTVILVNKTAELVIVQKLYQLGEYIFVLVHLTVNLIGCKITNSNRRALKISRKRLYFSDFKERLFHFNGTVVTKCNKCATTHNKKYLARYTKSPYLCSVIPNHNLIFTSSNMNKARTIRFICAFVPLTMLIACNSSKKEELGVAIYGYDNPGCHKLRYANK